jgi:hypothetical protein
MLYNRFWAPARKALSEGGFSHVARVLWSVSALMVLWHQLTCQIEQIARLSAGDERPVSADDLLHDLHLNKLSTISGEK